VKCSRAVFRTSCRTKAAGTRTDDDDFQSTPVGFSMFLGPKIYFYIYRIKKKKNKTKHTFLRIYIIAKKFLATHQKIDSPRPTEVWETLISVLLRDVPRVSRVAQMGTGPDMYSLLFPPRLATVTYLNTQNTCRKRNSVTGGRGLVLSSTKLTSVVSAAEAAGLRNRRRPLCPLCPANVWSAGVDRSASDLASSWVRCTRAWSTVTPRWSTRNATSSETFIYIYIVRYT